MRLEWSAALLFAVACSVQGEPRGGDVAAAVYSSGVLRIYKGQPGIANDIPRIDREEILSYHWSRIEVPQAMLTSGTNAFDMTRTDLGGAIVFWQFLKNAPGCDDAMPVPWILKFQNGDPKVHGQLEIDISAEGVAVRYDLYINGIFEGPCGPAGAGIGLSNNYVAVPR